MLFHSEEGKEIEVGGDGKKMKRLRSAAVLTEAVEKNQKLIVFSEKKNKKNERMKIYWKCIVCAFILFDIDYYSIYIEW